VVFRDVDMYPSHHMVFFQLLGKPSQQVQPEIIEVLMYSSSRAHVPKLEPVVTPHIV
jgi:hypothetical protein